MNTKISKIFGSTMLIAGTSTGAAMLAMPILTGLFGFIGTMFILVACWLFMYWTATLILEACLQFEDNVSFITMARKVYGKGGALVTWIIFLLLFYSLVAAYLSGSGRIFFDAMERYFQVSIPDSLNVLPLLVIFAPFIYFGLAAVDHLNRVLMFGMMASYIAIIIWIVPGITWDNLLLIDWSFSLLSFSVVVTSFGYHVIIPTLVSYLERDIKSIKRSLFYGSFIPLLIYMFWELAILGSVPVSGAHGLASAFMYDEPLAKLLRIQFSSDFVALLSQAFSLFAIVTSFLGVAQGLFDFLKDGFQAKKSHHRRAIAFLATFLPPVLMIFLFERRFILLLDYAGAMVAIILGIIPIMIVWRLRLKGTKTTLYRAAGGYFSLALGVVFFSFVVLFVILKNFGLFTFDVARLL